MIGTIAGLAFLGLALVVLAMLFNPSDVKQERFAENHAVRTWNVFGSEFTGTEKEFHELVDRWLERERKQDAKSADSSPCYYCGQRANAVNRLCPKCGAPATPGMRAPRRPPRPEIGTGRMWR